MKKLDILNGKNFRPKAKTIKFLLDFSKSIEVLRKGNQTFLVSKN